VTLIRLQEHLRLDRCPHCGVDRPNLPKLWESYTTNSEGTGKRLWRAYRCARCGGITTAFANEPDGYTDGIFPYDEGKRSRDILDKPRAFLEQAIASLHAPAGAVMLAASSIDAMLKEKGYVEGSLYSRIDKAATEHLITDGMAKWAHRVRLDANDQRHSDVNAGLPSEADARRSIEFTEALAQFLFVLPGLVQAGLKATDQSETAK
jgi:DNA-directed RNA polymerase subunit RPC12/RpoP